MLENSTRVFSDLAIACGLELEEASRDIALSWEAARQTSKSAAGDVKLDRIWPAFFKDYSNRCVYRWQKELQSNSSTSPKKLWRECFEQLWVAGCNYMKNTTMQNIRNGYEETVKESKLRGESLTDQDLNKLKQYFFGKADELDTVISDEMMKFAKLQRELICKSYSKVFKDEVLEEMCKLLGLFEITRRASRKGLSYSEINILGYKANSLLSSAGFAVKFDADENEMKRWINHPGINSPLPDRLILNMAAHSPISANFMEQLLRKLFSEEFDHYWEIAQNRIDGEN
jgi:hypothetical protein